MGKIEKELITLIKLGKKTGDMRLKNLAREALFALQSDDGTPGLGVYLWENYITQNLALARKRAKYHYQTQNAVNFAKIMHQRRVQNTLMRRCRNV